ncbi:MAG: MBL fold metallo-hydrolase [Ignavibacteriae bacterium]|nr:MBL fold metallo-hydrolase [Ignavibacteriota bacterium]
MIEIQKFIFNPFQENTYVVWDKSTKESIIIDPGCNSNYEEEILIEFVEKNNLKIKYLINTHCHIDHIFGNSFIKEKYQCDFLAPELDIPLLDKLLDQANMFGVSAKKSPRPNKFISEDLKLNLGENKISFLFTPGHTAGEFSILINNNICFSGDVLFLEGIGRTDLWGGDYKTLINSIESKLFRLDDNTKVYPGHGDETTIGYEKINNPFLK